MYKSQNILIYAHSHILMQHNACNINSLSLQCRKMIYFSPPFHLEDTFELWLTLKEKKKNQAAYARGLKERSGNGDRDQHAMAKLVASTQGSFHSRLTWDSRLEAPALRCSKAHVCECLSPAQPRTLFVSDDKISERAPTSWSALQCSQAPITAELVPFSYVLEVMWSALQGQQHSPTYLRNFWRCSEPSTTVLKK